MNISSKEALFSFSVGHLYFKEDLNNPPFINEDKYSL